jgi:allantoin racemase
MAMKRILLINPNTDASTTQAMLAIARESVTNRVAIEAITAPSGVPMITHPVALRDAGEVLATMIPQLCQQGWDGVITAAYGDPALEALREALPCPVTGIGEASMLEAAQFGAFAVVTTTPDLAPSITSMAERLHLTSEFQGVFLTNGDAIEVTRDPVLLIERLEAACMQALNKAPIAPASLIIGGGPLASAARTLTSRIPVRLVEPIPSAVRRIMTLIEEQLS